MDKGNVAKNYLAKKTDFKLPNKKESEIYKRIGDNIWIEADIKFARTNLKLNFKDIEELYEQSKGRKFKNLLCL